MAECKADGDGSLGECFFSEVEKLLEGHNLHCRQSHPMGLCLLPSMYCVTVMSTQVQHRQGSLESYFKKIKTRFTINCNQSIYQSRIPG